MLSAIIVYSLQLLLSSSLYPLSEAAVDCTAELPATSIIKSAVNQLHSINSTSITLQDGPYYTCLMVGNNGTQLSITVGYRLSKDSTTPSTNRRAHIELECNGGLDWVIESVSSVERNDTNSNCSVSPCNNSSTDGSQCQACTSSNTTQCNSVLYCAESDKVLCNANTTCSTTEINTSSLTTTINSSSRCICGVLCLAGYSFDPQSCTCYLTDICLADKPCGNNGSCTLDTTPDQYTCNCTGTGYTGTNCTVSRQKSTSSATPLNPYPSPSPLPTDCIRDHECIRCSPTSSSDCCIQCINGLTIPQHCVCPSSINASTIDDSSMIMVTMSSSPKTKSNNGFPLSSDLTIVMAVVCLGVVVLLIITMIALFICAIRYYTGSKRDPGNVNQSDLVLVNNSTLPSQNGGMQSPSHKYSSFDTSNDYITPSADYSMLTSNGNAPAHDGDNENNIDDYLFHFDPSLLKIVMDSLPEAYFNPMAAAHYEMTMSDNDSFSHHSLEHIQVNTTDDYHDNGTNHRHDGEPLEQAIDQQQEQPTSVPTQQAPPTDNDDTMPSHDTPVDSIVVEYELDTLRSSPSLLADRTNNPSPPLLSNNDSTPNVPAGGVNNPPPSLNNNDSTDAIPPQQCITPIVPDGGVSIL